MQICVNICYNLASIRDDTITIDNSDSEMDMDDDKEETPEPIVEKIQLTSPKEKAQFLLKKWNLTTPSQIVQPISIVVPTTSKESRDAQINYNTFAMRELKQSPQALVMVSNLHGVQQIDTTPKRMKRLTVADKLIPKEVNITTTESFQNIEDESGIEAIVCNNLHEFIATDVYAEPSTGSNDNNNSALKEEQVSFNEPSTNKTPVPQRIAINQNILIHLMTFKFQQMSLELLFETPKIYRGL